MANEEVIRYILKHRHSYPREAIDAKLLAGEYSPGDIDEAWELVESGAVPEPSGKAKARPTGDLAAPPGVTESVAGSPLFWIALLGVGALSYALPLGIINIYAPVPTRPPADVVTAAWAAFGGVQLVALLGALLVRNRQRSLAAGLVLGVAIALVVLPCAALTIITGLFFWGLPL